MTDTAELTAWPKRPPQPELAPQQGAVVMRWTHQKARWVKHLLQRAWDYPTSKWSLLTVVLLLSLGLALYLSHALHGCLQVPLLLAWPAIWAGGFVAIALLAWGIMAPFERCYYICSAFALTMGGIGLILCYQSLVG